MATRDFHRKRFDEGTLTKLQIFELYAREWLPVFLSPERPPRPEIHIFDFFAGPGTDSGGELGSPLRLLRQLKDYQGMAGWPQFRVHAHFSDSSQSKIKQLEANIYSHQLRLPGLNLDVEPLKFEDAIERSGATLTNPHAAKLLFIDQFGVDHVTPDVFRRLVGSPTCDFLFFLSSSTLHRFRDHPAIKQKITRPDDYYQVHQAALDYYRGYLPTNVDYFLAPFSIKKGSNIYGLIFGSAHPLGMDKFLQVAWKRDQINGEADFDINRDNIAPGEMLLDLLLARRRHHLGAGVHQHDAGEGSPCALGDAAHLLDIGRVERLDDRHHRVGPLLEMRPVDTVLEQRFGVHRDAALDAVGRRLAVLAAALARAA